RPGRTGTAPVAARRPAVGAALRGARSPGAVARPVRRCGVAQQGKLHDPPDAARRPRRRLHHPAQPLLRSPPMSLPARITAAIDKLRGNRRDPLCAYLYDLPALEQRVRAMRAVLPAGCELFYAAKANPEVPILRTLAPLVDGFEAASGGELAWLHEHCPGQPLIFGGPGKLDSELDAALDCRIDAFHVESVHELRRLARLAAVRGLRA